LIPQVNKMLRWRLSDEPVTEQEKDVDGNVDLEARKQVATSPFQPRVVCNTALPGQMYDFPWLYLQHHQQVGRDQHAAHVDLHTVAPRANSLSSCEREEFTHDSSSGLREIVRFLCQHRLVDCIVSTGGGIEEDFIKCLGPTKIGACGAERSCARTRLMHNR
jgi:hypothetical protein